MTTKEVMPPGRKFTNECRCRVKEVHGTEKERMIYSARELLEACDRLDAQAERIEKLEGLLHEAMPVIYNMILYREMLHRFLDVDSTSAMQNRGGPEKREEISPEQVLKKVHTDP